MSKRFTDTRIWAEDWFLDMPIEYKLFWFYMLSSCDHAGFFKVNLKTFCGLNEVKLTPKKAIEYFNSGKERIKEINENLWIIEDFFVYQYGNTLNKNNRVHESIEKEYIKHNINLSSIRGLLEVKEKSNSPQSVVNDRVKEKDKEKDKDKELSNTNLLHNKLNNTTKNEKNNQRPESDNSQGENAFIRRVRSEGN